jgi:hemerythrin-like metal-binding protein
MDARFLIGLPEMDEQHSTIFELAAKARRASQEGTGMNEIVLGLIGYANSHLEKEEAFLRKRGLGDFAKEHAEKHLLFRIQAMDFYDAFRDAGDNEKKRDLLRQIGAFCETWLAEHIDREDRKYAEILRSKSGPSRAF